MRYSDGEFLSTYHRVRSPSPNNGIPEVPWQTPRLSLNPMRNPLRAFYPASYSFMTYKVLFQDLKLISQGAFLCAGGEIHTSLLCAASSHHSGPGRQK